MKMKIIDLLVKIANGEKVPKKIKFWNSIWEYRKDGRMLDYINDDKCLMEYVAINKDGLNQDIEIIEEPNKIEKIARCDDVKMTHYGELYKPTENQEILRIKINELIDEINNLKEND